MKMIYIMVLVLFTCDTGWASGSGLGNLKITIKKTNYNAQIPALITNEYLYDVHDSLELKCGGPNPVYLEWTDKNHKISQKSCSETRDFTLKLEKIGENDHGNIFMCNSTNEYNSVTLIIRNREDSSRFQKNSNVCYEIIKDSYKNCSHNLRKEIIIRKQTQCPTEMTDNSTYQNTTAEFNHNSGDPGNNFTLLCIGVVVFAFITLIILTFWMIKCYNIVKERKNDQHIYEEPNAVVYAELQVKNNDPPNLPNRNDPPYAKIVGVLTHAQ